MHSSLVLENLEKFAIRSEIAEGHRVLHTSGPFDPIPLNLAIDIKLICMNLFKEMFG